MIKKILVLSPHTDDGEIASGASIAKFAEEGKDVYYAAFSTCDVSVPEPYPKDILKDEVRKATKILGINNSNLILFNYEVRKFPLFRQEILDDIIKLNKKIQPDLVLIPSSNDIHQDHKTIHEEALRAFKKTSTILGYEHPWNNLTFTTDVFIKVEEKHLNKKIRALQEYRSQQELREYFNEKYLLAWALTRGKQIDVDYAETFEVLRWIIE